MNRKRLFFVHREAVSGTSLHGDNRRVFLASFLGARTE
jgi:hypothetical protein